MGSNEGMAALLESLTIILGSCTDSDLRKASEQHVNSASPVELSFLACNPQLDHGLRQLCCATLKQQVKRHWSEASRSYEEPMTDASVKVAVRNALLTGLSEANSKVRTSIAMVIGAIAKWDMPEEWPELLPWLLQAVRCRNGLLSEYCTLEDTRDKFDCEWVHTGKSEQSWFAVAH